ncbi:MAG TPA: PQQ-binding-like beta-propeller repeat protein [Chthoniobacteraceae bacterium]|jgi:outer membrane protein assembly factor BamB
MSHRAVVRSIQIFLIVAVLGTAGVFWYFVVGRKPKVLLSTPIKAGHAQPFTQGVGAGEVLLLVGSKATLYDLGEKKDRWSVDLNTVAPVAAVVPAAVAKPAPTPKLAAKPVAATPPPEKPDPLLTARVKKRFAKLEKSAADLHARRDKLKTALQIEAFNESAAKYHAELAEARAEAAPLHRSALAAAGSTIRELDGEDFEERSFRSGFAADQLKVIAEHGTIWIARGKRITGLSSADGRVVRDLQLAGNFTQLERGPQHLYVLAPVGSGETLQIIRIATADGAPNAVTVAVPPEQPTHTWSESGPASPNTPALRTLFSANASSLLQLSVRLVERKITERQTITGDTVSDMEEADKKTTGGWGADAAVIAGVLAKDAEREATGGKELLDESTYEVALQRPFETNLPETRATVHGRPELFSTATLDLVVAGKELVAFDHGNKKLWQTQLGQPISGALKEGEVPRHGDPCLEAGDRLYFFDRGFLSAFQRETGQALWRLPAAGIHKIQLDPGGTLYVSTGSGPAGIPQLFQIEAKTGRILWKLEKYDDCFLSGKDVYATRETRNAEDMVNAVFDRSKAIQCRWKLYKLSTRDGEPQWEWFQTRRPLSIQTDRKRVSLLFQDELQVLTSLAL